MRSPPLFFLLATSFVLSWGNSSPSRAGDSEGDSELTRVSAPRAPASPEDGWVNVSTSASRAREASKEYWEGVSSSKGMTVSAQSLKFFNPRDPNQLEICKTVEILRVSTPLEEKNFLRLLKCVPNLRHLKLDKVPFNEEIWGAIQALKNLASLEISEGGRGWIEGLKKTNFAFLEALVLDRLRLNSDDLSKLCKRISKGKFPNLKTLSLQGNGGNIDNPKFIEILEALKTRGLLLENLDLSGADIDWGEIEKSGETKVYQLLQELRIQNLDLTDTLVPSDLSAITKEMQEIGYNVLKEGRRGIELRYKKPEEAAEAASGAAAAAE